MSIVESVVYEAPGESGSPVVLRERYKNFIGGEWIAPTTGEYRENVTPSTGESFCEVAHSVRRTSSWRSMRRTRLRMVGEAGRRLSARRC